MIGPAGSASFRHVPDVLSVVLIDGTLRDVPPATMRGHGGQSRRAIDEIRMQDVRMSPTWSWKRQHSVHGLTVPDNLHGLGQQGTYARRGHLGADGRELLPRGGGHTLRSNPRSALARNVNVADVRGRFNPHETRPRRMTSRPTPPATMKPAHSRRKPGRSDTLVRLRLILSSATTIPMTGRPGLVLITWHTLFCVIVRHRADELPAGGATS